MRLRQTFTKAVMASLMMTACLACLSRPAFAGSGDTTFGVSATVAGSCTISATDVDLGAYSNASNSSGAATITYQCTPGLSPSIALDTGLYGGMNGPPTTNNRAMSNGAGGLLGYNIYQDAGLGTVWGDGTNGANPKSVTADGNADTVSAFVFVQSGSSVPAGSYSDTVTATIGW